MLKIFRSPARYVQGRDATRELAKVMCDMGIGGQPLMIVGREMRGTLEPLWRESFGALGTDFDIYDFGGECSFTEIERIKAELKRRQSSAVVGAGGGKALDTARAAGAALGLPVVCCPTLASSDAPTSAVSVVYTPEGDFEKYLFHARNPDLVLVDTVIIARAPARFLVAGMGDALATWFEADTVHRAAKANQVGGSITIAAMALAELCYRTLQQDGVAALAAVRAQAVTPALERVIEANTLLSGLGFESGGLAVAHAVHNGLTAVAETHQYLHGEKVAFGTLVQLVLEGRSAPIVDEVLDFCLSVGLPVCLADLGITQLSPVQAQQIAEIAVAPGETAHNEPFAVSWMMIRDAILAADALGRQRKHGNGSHISQGVTAYHVSNPAALS